MKFIWPEEMKVGKMYAIEYGHSNIVVASTEPSEIAEMFLLVRKEERIASAGRKMYTFYTPTEKILWRPWDKIWEM
jgi:hypothetical protein